MDLVILLLLLVGPYLVARVFSLKVDPSQAGALGPPLLFLMTGVGHFAFTEKMTLMLPEWLPMRTHLVLATGVLELALAAALLARKTREVAGWVAIVFLLAVFPANVYASLTYASMGGGSLGPLYLLIRAPVQLAFIAWIWRFCVQPARRMHPEVK